MRSVMAYEEIRGSGFAPALKEAASAIVGSAVRFLRALAVEIGRIPEYSEDAERLRQSLRLRQASRIPRWSRDE